MRFLEQQQSAQRTSRRLRVQFAVLALLGPLPLNGLVAFVLWFFPNTEAAGLLSSLFGASVHGPIDQKRLFYMLAMLTAVSATLLAALVMLRESQLRDASRAFAEPAGAEDDVDWQNTGPGLTSQQLKNIVEEMALAAGVPAPAVCEMHFDKTINSMSLGHSTADATIFVTRGAMQSLTRAELQGMVAHELSHILNGDMALNMRVAAFVYAFSVVPRVAIKLFEIPLKVPSWRVRVFLWLAFAPAAALLWLVGSAHLLAARLLQASLGREREMLADASAVQFTRDPLGVKGALLKIAASRSVYERPRPWADDVAHMYFAPVVERRWLDAHPPITERLRALDPHFLESEIDEYRERTKGRRSAERSRTNELRRTRKEGNRERERRDFVASAVLIATEPASATKLHAAQSEPEAPMARLLALLLAFAEADRNTQLAIVRERLGDALAASVERRIANLGRPPDTQRLAMLHQELSGLRGMTASDTRALLETTQRLVRLDERRLVAEYALGRTAIVFLRDLLRRGEPHGKRTLTDATSGLGVLLCVLAREGHAGEQEARRAFEAGMSRLLPRDRPEFAVIRPWARSLDRALDELDELQPVAKELLVEAMMITIRHDDRITQDELELVRTIASGLHCPICVENEAGYESAQARSKL
jgi:Zn-dependent protease with chaperone function